jgi:hypothetical protein
MHASVLRFSLKLSSLKGRNLSRCTKLNVKSGARDLKCAPGVSLRENGVRASLPGERTPDLCMEGEVQSHTAQGILILCRPTTGLINTPVSPHSCLQQREVDEQNTPEERVQSHPCVRRSKPCSNSSCATPRVCCWVGERAGGIG